MTSEIDQRPQMLCGRYILTDNSKSGGQGTVTKAYDIRGAREVAIKRMDRARNSMKSSESFNREVETLRDLRHDNIVEFIEVELDPTDRSWFIVLEWIPDTLHDLIAREGQMSWAAFWDRFGKRLLDAIVYAQSRKVAHRDIKPSNILITPQGTPKLADYGTAKFVDLHNAWAVEGITLRFDHSPGYTPSTPEDPTYNFSKDCFGFAAVAVSCLTGRLFTKDEELRSAVQAAGLPAWARPLIEQCISLDPSERPAMASVFQARLEQAEADANADGAPRITVHLTMSYGVRTKLERAFSLDGDKKAEALILDELGEASSLVLDGAADDSGHGLQLIGVEWAFNVVQSGRYGEALELKRANEVGASLASSLRDRGLPRALSYAFSAPADREAAGSQLTMLLRDAEARHTEISAERTALAEQRIFKIWRSYLRDRADLEAKRKNAIKYVDKVVSGSTIIFTTELAHNADIVGQDRMVSGPNGKVTGKITTVSFNQVSMEVLTGDPGRILRRGEISINSLAAQRALDVQNAALDAVVYERAVNPGLKQLILDPRTARPPIPAKNVEPIEQDFDPEKLEILRVALGVSDILAIEGPPGTGKTKLITEIVVQWLQRNPGHRILLASQTHIAIDNVIERVAEFAPDLDIIRVGRIEEPRISDFGKTLLLEKRVEAWIADVRKNAEAEMSRWAEAQGIDRGSVEVGMKVERLIGVLELQRELRDHIAEHEAEGEEAKEEAEEASTADTIGREEESAELDSEIATYKKALREITAEEKAIREAMRGMGDYAEQLSSSSDPWELGDWAAHLLPQGAEVELCRNRLNLLEMWSLRVGRSPDFNAAMLSSAQIIAGTCVGVAGVRGMQEVAYDLCIVDEASKATPTEILSPMARCRKWIVVGDPKQLPPFFEEFGDQLRAETDTAEVKATLLDRLLRDQAGLPSRNRARLSNQYRMITPIGNLISECFYDNSLHSPIKSHGLKLGAILKQPVVWRSTHRLPKHIEQQRESSYFNVAELGVVRDELKRLQFVSRAQSTKITVAVIAGYTAQVEDLRDMINRGVAEWQNLDVECNTVDAFQGRQADICIYSIVRSNPRIDLGFLREQPRLNVALSRGKSALIIVGDFVFCRGVHGQNPFRKVVKYFDEHDKDCLVDILQ
ncbi:serine/threonine-protein kinase [Sphingobium sp. YR768]|uniref:serine/threonine-protein kinase n=1 Tax=Sphingobium sp. YR768 TaxID=1884365 RepID=UPI0008B72FB6|nr:serine/threonine-protein kinase [Sphingobium sp. YR768]SES18646.1 Protein kinase domain-containing protein [Sphingobium sp. YR768]